MVEGDIFRGDQGYQSVIPPLMAPTPGQQQQAATFSAHQFPNSWNSYLSGPQPQSKGAELQKAAAPGSGSSDPTPAPRQTQEAKQQRIREKNRRAMKKFRERQKVSPCSARQTCRTSAKHQTMCYFTAHLA